MMAKYDQGGGCACGLKAVCDCGSGQSDGSKPGTKAFKQAEHDRRVRKIRDIKKDAEYLGIKLCNCGGSCGCNAPEQTARPWGYWRVLATEDGYKVKELVIYPGQEISRQFHNDRAETWVIIQGAGRIERGYPDLLDMEGVITGDTIMIRQKEVHKIINIGENSLIAVEVQTGTRCDEADITRI
jgi:mannose-6-phosphate isomerase-like protein (cupin superfamily)